MIPVLEAALGNRTAAWALLFLAAYGEGHANRVARTYGLAVSVVRDQLVRLEANGALVSRMVGRSGSSSSTSAVRRRGTCAVSCMRNSICSRKTTCSAISDSVSDHGAQASPYDADQSGNDIANTHHAVSSGSTSMGPPYTPAPGFGLFEAVQCPVKVAPAPSEQQQLAPVAVGTPGDRGRRGPQQFEPFSGQRDGRLV